MDSFERNAHPKCTYARFRSFVRLIPIRSLRQGSVQLAQEISIMLIWIRVLAFTSRVNDDDVRAEEFAGYSDLLIFLRIL
jgi:hypothetical protein